MTEINKQHSSWWRILIMRMLIMKFSPASLYILLGQNILLRTLLSNNLNVCSSLSLRDKVSQSQKTMGNIIVLKFKAWGFMVKNYK
jgi:hypothetical protein